MENKDNSFYNAKIKLERAIARLIYQMPFHGSLIQKFKRLITTTVPTPGVNVTTTINLYLNPYFGNALTEPELVEVLKHELDHVLRDHLGRSKEKELEHRLFNISADVAINQYLPNIPKKFSMFDKDGKLIKDDAEPMLFEKLKKKFPKILPNETAEYYYKFFEEERNKNGQGQGEPQDGDGQGQPNDGYGDTIDDHSIWKEGEQSSAVVKEIVKNAVNETVKEMGGVGKLPNDVLLLVNALNHQARDWKQEIQRFIARSSELVIEPTKKKRNRRYGILYPGYKKDPILSLVVVIDSSGSVYNEETMGQFAAELYRLHKMGVHMHIIECDSEVKRAYEYDGNIEVDFTGGGGTAFQPALDKAKEFNPDGLIYLTDGENFDDITKPTFPVLWALLPGYKKPVDWGSETVIDIRHV